MSRGFDPIFAFPTLSHNCRLTLTPRRDGFPPPPRAEVRRPKRPPFRPALHSIPPCVIFAVLPLQKMKNVSKSRTVESKSGAWKMGDIVAGSEGAAAGAGKASGEEDGVAGSPHPATPGCAGAGM